MMIEKVGILCTCEYPALRHWTLPPQEKMAGNNSFCLAGKGSVQASWLCVCISQAYTWAGCEPLLSAHTQDAALTVPFAREETSRGRCCVH